MPFEHDAIINAQAEVLAARHARAMGEYESARQLDDGEATLAAADQLVEVQARIAALNLIKQQQSNMQAMAQAAAPNRYGLSPEEIDIAHKSYTERGDRSDLTRDQKEQLYAQQKAKLQHMKRTGEYSVDQGQVFK